MDKIKVWWNRVLRRREMHRYVNDVENMLDQTIRELREEHSRRIEIESRDMFIFHNYEECTVCKHLMDTNKFIFDNPKKKYQWINQHDKTP